MCKLLMEANVMKKRLLSLIIVLIVMIVGWTAYAEEGRASRGDAGSMSPEKRNQMRSRFQNMSEEERQKFREEMRAKYENMSEEERQTFREQMRTRFQNTPGQNRPQPRQRSDARARFSAEDQLKAVAAMEKQLAKLKANIKNLSAAMPTNPRGLSEEERAKLREKLGKSRANLTSSVGAIRAQLDKISPARPSSPQTAVIRELKALSALAEREKAERTKKRIDALIEKQTRQNAQTRQAARRPADAAGQRRNTRGTDEDAVRRPARRDSDPPRRPTRDSDSR